MILTFNPHFATPRCLFPISKRSSSSSCFQTNKRTVGLWRKFAASELEGAHTSHLESGQSIDHDLDEEIKQFVTSKVGVKELADSGIAKIPRIFHYRPKTLVSPPSSNEGLAQLQVPVIDLSCCATSMYPQIVEQAREASESWGFFQIVNHGIPLHIMEEILEGTRQFHEQPTQVKRPLYRSEAKQRVRFSSNGLLQVSKKADWRDSLACDYHDGLLDPEAIPFVCRKAVSNYMEHMMKLKETLSQLLSTALGLNTDYLSSIECMSSANLACHYYPPCPEPELTMGAAHHSDPLFLTILLQDTVGGLQVLHQNHWVDVKPVSGALTVNIGDLLQLITNDKFNSVEHRVLAGKKGPRASVACFFYPSIKNKSKPYGPIQELLNLENKQAIYKEISVVDFMEYFRSKGLGGKSLLPHFKQ